MHTKFYLAATGVLVILAPAHAAQQQSRAPVIVTTTPLTIDQWAARTGKELESRLRFPHYMLGREANEGIVRVRFECSEDGTPAAVALANSSGHRELDKAALRAVNAIRTLHPLPAGVDHGQRFQAVILFAKDQQSYEQQTKALRDGASRSERLAARRGAPLAVSIGLLSAR